MVMTYTPHVIPTEEKKALYLVVMETKQNQFTGAARGHGYARRGAIGDMSQVMPTYVCLRCWTFCMNFIFVYETL